MATPTTTDISDFQKPGYDYLAKRGITEYQQFFNTRKTTFDMPVVGYNYLFFTAPELYLGSPLNSRVLSLPNAGDSIYTPSMVTTLSKGNGFIPILTNRASKYSSSDLTFETIDYSETWTKHKIVIGKHMEESRMAGTFTIDYADDHTLYLMRMHQLWSSYIENAFKGRVKSRWAEEAPSKSTATSAGSSIMDLLAARYCDYLVSMYHFATLPDGETLIYWAKYTGVMPKKLPWSMMTSEDQTQSILTSIPIEYDFAHKDDMEIRILDDFNLVAGNKANASMGKDVSTYAGWGSTANIRANIPGSGVFPRIEYSSTTATGANTNSAGEIDLKYKLIMQSDT